MPQTICSVCNETVEQDHALTLPACGHKDFHFECIVDLFAEKFSSRKPIECPECGARAQTIPAPTTVPILQLMTSPLRTVIPPAKTVVNPTFNDVWPQVWAKLKAARDGEAKLICVDARKPEVAPDVTRQDLTASRQQTNYRELTSCCRICKKLLGNLHWARLGSCKMKHPFHVWCLASKFVRTLYNQPPHPGAPDQQQKQLDHALECPVCHTPAKVPNLRLNQSLTDTINHHLKEVPEETIAYCMNFLFEQSKTA